jgi:hypothetical protein
MTGAAAAVMSLRSPAPVPSIPAAAGSLPATAGTGDAQLPPPHPAPYEVAPNEAAAEAKRVAVRAVETLTTYEPGTSLSDLSAKVLEPHDLRRQALEDAAGSLHHPGSWSRGTVVYPQLGGLTSARSSVMVVVRQEVGRGSEPDVVRTPTLDVRLVRTETGWVFDELASDGGEEVARPPDLTPEAAAVVDDPRIELPDSARWDIYAGRVAPSLLRLMAEIADRTPYGVVVIDSGHPFHVFGTTRQSAHTRGYAIDIYRVGDVRVIDDREPGSTTYDLVRWLYDHPGLAQLGSPWALDGRGGRSFTDAVHQDHLHVAVS